MSQPTASTPRFLRWFYLSIYSMGLVLLTLGFSEAFRSSPSLVQAKYAPRGSNLQARTPQLALKEYIEQIEDGYRFRVSEATQLVHFATRHVGHRNVNFSENWVQWCVGQIYSPILQTQDPDLLIAGRLGNCADRSLILKSIAELAGMRCRFVGLSGHVVLEIEIGDEWWTADPDYNVTYQMSVAELAKPENIEQLCEPLRRRRYTHDVIENYIGIVQSEENNLRMEIGSPLSPRLDFIERICKILSWILPALFLISAIPLLGYRSFLPKG